MVQEYRSYKSWHYFTEWVIRPFTRCNCCYFAHRTRSITPNPYEAVTSLFVIYIRHLWNCHNYALCKMGFSNMLQIPPKCTNICFFWQYLPVPFLAEINWPSSLRIARSICFIIGIYDEGWLFLRHASMCWNIVGPTHIYLNPDDGC